MGMYIQTWISLNFGFLARKSVGKHYIIEQYKGTARALSKCWYIFVNVFYRTRSQVKTPSLHCSRMFQLHYTTWTAWDYREVVQVTWTSIDRIWIDVFAGFREIRSHYEATFSDSTERWMFVKNETKGHKNIIMVKRA